MMLLSAHASAFLLAALAPTLSQAADVYYDWNLQAFLGNAYSPDCTNVEFPGRHLYLAENSFPGPVIDVTEGDIVHVRVTNLHPSATTTIHWHGIHQRGTPYSDGPSFITQCPTTQKTTQEYVFEAFPAGTHFWHAHASMHKPDGLAGPIIVRPKDPEPHAYDDEFTMFLQDWYIQNGEDQLVGLKSVPIFFKDNGAPDSLLINGKGLAPECDVGGVNFGDPTKCLDATQGCNLTDTERLNLFDTTVVEAGKTYRLRLINSGQLIMMNFAIAQHNLTVIQVEGTHVDPFEVESLDIAPGERYDVLITADQTPDSYWIETTNRERILPVRSGITGRAILQYASAPSIVPVDTPNHPGVDDAAFGIAKDAALFTSNVSAYPESVALTADEEDVKRFVLVGSPGFNGVGQLVWAINNVTNVKGPGALLSRVVRESLEPGPPGPVPGTTPLSTEPPTTYDYGNLGVWFGPGAPGLAIGGEGEVVVEFEKGDVFEFVMQNTFVGIPGILDFHPWHVHGHSFWVVGSGDGTYDPETDVANYNLVNPVLRDTATLWHKQWYALRMVANNPGVWFMHCHILSHEVLGMSFSIITEPEDVECPTSTLTQCVEPDLPPRARGQCRRRRRQNVFGDD